MDGWLCRNALLEKRFSWLQNRVECSAKIRIHVDSVALAAAVVPMNIVDGGCRLAFLAYTTESRTTSAGGTCDSCVSHSSTGCFSVSSFRRFFVLLRLVEQVAGLLDVLEQPFALVFQFFSALLRNTRSAGCHRARVFEARLEQPHIRPADRGRLPDRGAAAGEPRGALHHRPGREALTGHGHHVDTLTPRGFADFTDIRARVVLGKIQ